MRRRAPNEGRGPRFSGRCNSLAAFAVSDELTITPEQAGQTLAALVRAHRPGHSWSQVRRLIETRHLKLNGELCMDPARRVKDGDTVQLLDRPAALPAEFAGDLAIRHLDAHVVVVEKPAGISTVRHPAEREWDARRRKLVPTLDDRLHRSLAERLAVSIKQLPRLRKVHRLDKLTSGLVVFARSAFAERELGRQFFAHTVDRRYWALVHGRPMPQSIKSFLIRDRGDGRRGSSQSEHFGKLAVTHIESVEPIGPYSLVVCRLETGRTHQIRIHLAELGHPVCGEPVYVINRDGSKFDDRSGAPRLALHATELGFDHPASGERLRWEMPLPKDLGDWLAAARSGAT